jgi:hypothetical protein
MSRAAQLRRATSLLRAPSHIPQDYLAEVELEHARWTQIDMLVSMLTPDERLVPGYYRDPAWSVQDLMAHLTIWLEEAAEQLTDIAARLYRPHDADVDQRNADALAAARHASWDTVWDRATAARADMLQAWFALREPTEPANQWVRKAGAEHYGEHLEQLRAWVGELVAARTRPPSDSWDS